MEIKYKIDNVIIESFVIHPDGRSAPVNSNTPWNDEKYFTHPELNDALQQLHKGFLFDLVKKQYIVNYLKMIIECSSQHQPSDKLCLERTF